MSGGLDLMSPQDDCPGRLLGLTIINSRSSFIVTLLHPLALLSFQLLLNIDLFQLTGESLVLSDGWPSVQMASTTGWSRVALN